MFDTHTHLYFPEFLGNEKRVINDARDMGVKYFMIPGTDRDSSEKASIIADTYHHVYCACGIHPTENLDKLDPEKDLSWIYDLPQKHKRVAAIGEIGLDYYHFKSAARLQIIFLKEQLKIAVKTGLSVIIHNRQATEDMINTLSEFADRLQGRVVFHCSEPDKDIYSFALKNNFFLGVDGDLTYDNSKKEFYKNIDIERIVLETDSPYLTPFPVRNEKRFPNEPKNVKYVAEKLSEIKGIQLSEVISQTTENAKKLFGIK